MSRNKYETDYGHGCKAYISGNGEALKLGE